MILKLISPSVIALMLIMGLAPEKVLPPKPFTGKVVAIADGGEEIHGEFHGGERRVFTDVLGRDLVDGGGQLIVGAFGEFRLGGAEE